MSEQTYLAVGTMVLALATLALVVVTFVQGRDTRKFQYGNLIFQLQDAFLYRDKQLEMIARIEEKKPLLAPRGPFTEYDLDSYLAYFELFALYDETRLLPTMLIYWMFGHYVKAAWELSEINCYVKGLRTKRKDEEYYMAFEQLADRMKRIDTSESLTERLGRMLRTLRSAWRQSGRP